MPTIGYALPPWVAPLQQYFASQQTRRIENEQRAIRDDQEQAARLQAGLSLGGMALGAGIGGIAAGGLGSASTGGLTGLQGAGLGAGIGGGIGTAVGGLATGNPQAAVQGGAQAFQALGHLGDMRAASTISQDLAGDAPDKVKNALGQLAYVDPSAAVQMGAGIFRNQQQMAIDDLRQGRIDARQQQQILAAAQRQWDGAYARLAPQYGGNQSLVENFIGKRPSWESMNAFNPRESMFDHVNWGGLGLQTEYDPNDVAFRGQVLTYDKGFQQAKQDLMSGVIGIDEFNMEAQQYREKTAALVPAKTAKPIQKTNKQKLEESLVQMPDGSAWILGKRDGEDKWTHTYNTKEIEAKLAAEAAKASAAKTKERLSLLDSAYKWWDGLKLPHELTPDMISQALSHVVGPEKLKEYGFPTDWQPTPGTADYAKIASQQAQMAEQARVAAAARTQSENLRQMAGQWALILQRFGDDPAKWGNSRDAGLALAMQMVMLDAPVPPKVAEALFRKIKAELGTDKPDAQTTLIIGKLAGMSE